MANSKFQYFEFLPCFFFKSNVEKNTLYNFQKLKFSKTVQFVSYACMDYIYSKCQVNRFKNGFHIVQKLWKCPYENFSNSFFDKNMSYRKMKIAPLNFPWNSASNNAFVVKITALKFSPFFTGISQTHVLNFQLTLTSHLTYF